MTREIIEKLRGLNDMAAVHADRLIQSALRYAAAVVTMESRLPLLRYRLQGDLEAYQFAVQEMDARRRTAHNALIAQIRIANRICAKSGLAPVCLNPDDREQAAVMAFRLVLEYCPGNMSHLREEVRCRYACVG